MKPKQVEKLERTALKLDKPAGEVKQARATRKVGYEQAQLAVSKWGSVVKANREAEHLSFPLASQHGGGVRGMYHHEKSDFMNIQPNVFDAYTRKQNKNSYHIARHIMEQLRDRF